MTVTGDTATTSAWVDSTLERYRSGGLAGALPAGRRPALLVVDLQRGFTEPAFTPGCDLDDAVEATRRLLDVARGRGAPVVFTAIAFTERELAELVWLRKMPGMADLRHDGPTREIDPRLGRRDEEPVLVKTAASAFSGTDLDDRLHSTDADSVIVCGATTSGCVRATVVDACAANWATFVPHECVGDREAGPHEASLLDMQAKYADVIAATAAATMLAGARRP